MSTTFRNKTTGTGTSSVVLNVPAGVVDGDLLIAITARTAAGTADSPPAGWTSFNNALGTAINWMGFYRIASSEPASYTFNANVPSNMAGVMLAYTSGGAYENGSTSIFTTTANAVAPSITTTHANDIVLAITASKSVSATGWTPPSGYTDRANSANGTIVSVDVSEKVYTAAGATGTQTTVCDRSTSGLAAHVVFIPGGVDVPVTGLSATGTLGSFSIVNGTNNSVNVTGLAGTMTLGSVKKEADYNAALAGTDDNLVRVGTTGLAGTGYPAGKIDNTTYISAGVCEVVPYGMPAFQGDAFQASVMAFQMEVMNFPRTLTATAQLGSITCANLYSFLPWTVSYDADGKPMRGDVGTLGEYRVDYGLAGVFGTGAVGVVVAGANAGPVNVTVSGVVATGAVGTLAFYFDMNFTWPTSPRFGIIYPKGKVGVVAVHFDKLFSVTGIASTAALGVIKPTNFVSVTGLQAAGHVGTVVYQSSVGVTGFVMSAQLGGFVAGWVQRVPVTGVQAAGQLGTVLVLNHNIFYGPAAPAAHGVLGAVTLQISPSATIVGVVGQGQLGVLGFVVSGSAAAAGLEATGRLGHVTPLGMPSMSVAGHGGVGQVGFIIDCNVAPLGIFCRARVGSVGEKRDSDAHVTGVQATGSIGSAAPALSSAHNHRNDIYVRLQ